MIERFGGFSKGETPTDRTFHEARWAREAEKLNRAALRGILIKTGVQESINSKEVMHKEAMLDNEQFDKRLSAEHAKWDEKLQEMVNDLRAVRDNSPGRPKHFKAVRLMLGSGLGSGIGTGQDMALEDMGYRDVFDVYIGSSGSAGSAAFAALGESRKAASIFMIEAMQDAFLKKRLGFVPKLDTEVILEPMRKGAKALDTDKLRSSPKEINTIVSDEESRRAQLLDLKTASPDPINTLDASSAIPFFRDSVEVDGRHYYDGAFSQVPLEDIIEKFKPTHLLIQPNVAFRYLQSYEYTGVDRAVLWTAAKMGYFATMRNVEEYFRMKENVRAFLEKIGEIHHVKIAVLWPPEEGLGPLVNDPDTMRRAILESYRETISIFGEKQPQTIELHPGDIPEIEEASDKLKRAV